MLPIISKEMIVSLTINYLQMLKEDLRTSEKRSVLEAHLPLYIASLSIIVEADIQDYNIVDVFEGLPNYKDLDKIYTGINSL